MSVKLTADSSIQMRMQYLGTLKLLADSSLLMGNSSEAEDTRELIERALTDAQKLIPRLKWRRVLQRFEVELQDLRSPDRLRLEGENMPIPRPKAHAPTGLARPGDGRPYISFDSRLASKVVVGNEVFMPASFFQAGSSTRIRIRKWRKVTEIKETEMDGLIRFVFDDGSEVEVIDSIEVQVKRSK